MTPIRRAFIDRKLDRVGVETEAGVVWTLPNPTPEGRHYDLDVIFGRVIREKQVNLERWERHHEAV